MSAEGDRVVVDDDLELRLLADGDAADLFALVDANRAHLRRWLSWLDEITTLENQRASIAESDAAWRAHVSGLRSYLRPAWSLGIYEGGSLVGTISLAAIDYSNRAAEVSYWLAEDAQGRGVAIRSTRALVAMASAKLGLHRVVIHCTTANARSAAVPRRLGFTLEGTERAGGWLYDHFEDYLVFSMLAPEWRERQASR